MWYEWECLNDANELIGYCVIGYDHEMTTDTLQDDAKAATKKMKSDQWLQSAVKLGKVSKV
jgi:hypothetical protein